jgi:hypothetical protein
MATLEQCGRLFWSQSPTPAIAFSQVFSSLPLAPIVPKSQKLIYGQVRSTMLCMRCSGFAFATVAGISVVVYAHVKVTLVFAQFPRCGLTLCELELELEMTYRLTRVTIRTGSTWKGTEISSRMRCSKWRGTSSMTFGLCGELGSKPCWLLASTRGRCRCSGLGKKGQAGLWQAGLWQVVSGR